MKKLMVLIVAVVMAAGMAAPVFSQDVESEVRDEINDSKDREEMELVGASEAKVAEYQDGKTLTDVHGNRVRLEQYIVAHRDLNQLEFVTYSKRDSGVDTLRGLYTLNKAMPTDIRTIGELDPQKWNSGVLSELQAPEYYAEQVETSASSDKGDAVKFSAVNGDLYVVPNDIAGTFGTEYKFDVIYQNAYVKVGTLEAGDITKIQATHVGGTAWDHGAIVASALGRIDYYLPKVSPSAPNELSNTFSIDPAKKTTDATRYTVNDAATLAAMTSKTTWDGTDVNDASMWEDMTLAQLLDKKIDVTSRLNFANGTFLQNRQLWIKDDGDQLTIRKFINLVKSLTVDNWAAKLSELNLESIWTATEFGERTIDVIWSPSIFIKAATSDVSGAN